MSLETLWETAAASNAEVGNVLAWYRQRRELGAAPRRDAGPPAEPAEPAENETPSYAFEFEVEDPKVLLAGLNTGFEPLERARRQVALFRALAAIEPMEYHEPLAVWLGGHAYELVQRERYEEAAAEFREAYALPGLNEEHYARLRVALVVVLEAIWTTLLQTDRVADAVPYLSESSDLLRDDPTKRAKVLSNLAAALAGTDVAGALGAVAESVTIRRALGDQAGLALCLNNQGDLYLRSGDPTAARDCLIEAVTIRCSLARSDPATYVVPLYRSLSGLVVVLRTLGLDDELRAAEAELSRLARLLGG